MRGIRVNMAKSILKGSCRVDCVFSRVDISKKDNAGSWHIKQSNVIFCLIYTSEWPPGGKCGPAVTEEDVLMLWCVCQS